MRERKGTKGKEERLVLTLLSFRGVGGTCGKATRGRGERKEKERKGEMGRGQRKETAVVVHRCKARL